MRARNKVDSDNEGLNDQPEDFFGIEEFAGDFDARSGDIFEDVKSNTLNNKHNYKEESKKRGGILEDEVEDLHDTVENSHDSVDKQVPTAFAQIRYDNENRPTKHGQYESGDGEISHLSRRKLSKSMISPQHLDQAQESARILSEQKKKSKGTTEKYSSMFTSLKDHKRDNSLRYPTKSSRSHMNHNELLDDDDNARIIDDEFGDRNPLNFNTKHSVERMEEVGEQSAYDVVHKIRMEKQEAKLKEMLKNDRDGSLMSLYKIWSVIPPLHQYTRKEVLDLLLKSVVYNEDGLVALNKPYGLPSIGGTGVRMSLSNFLEDLRQKIAPDSKRLFLAHRLDKSTTGVILLTTSEQRLSELKQFFARRTMTKRYWCIVRGFVEPAEGIIDIPLSETEIGGTYKMIPVPRRNDDNKELVRERANRISYKAVTEYKTLATASSCSLVETNIVTGVKHQIRSHMGYCMDRPILGDHKYSHYMKLLPQRLAPITLQQLGIRASKSRHLPIYLHAKEIIIPEASNGKNIFIKAPLPKFFLYTLKKLKLVL